MRLRPAFGFQDGKRLGEGVGLTHHRTMPIAGTAYLARRLNEDV